VAPTRAAPSRLLSRSATRLSPEGSSTSPRIEEENIKPPKSAPQALEDGPARTAGGRFHSNTRQAVEKVRTACSPSLISPWSGQGEKIEEGSHFLAGC
jgi:hypothetical protein